MVTANRVRYTSAIKLTRIIVNEGVRMSAENKAPLVGIIMGSESDMPAMEPCMKQLEEFGVPNAALSHLNA